jgi:ABC-type tungstate transport system permease subunit
MSLQSEGAELSVNNCFDVIIVGGERLDGTNVFSAKQFINYEVVSRMQRKQLF